MTTYYVGLDVHKKTVSYGIKNVSGTVMGEGVAPANRQALGKWAKGLKGEWMGGMEATLFTGWIYDFLKPYASVLRVAHPLRLRAITAAKKKNDRIDAATLADLLRCNLFPECYMAPPEIRELRRVLRYRNLLVQEATRMKNKASGLLMEVGATYDRKRLHGAKYFSELLGHLADVPQSVVELLKMTRVNLHVFEAAQKRLLDALVVHPHLKDRVERLQSIEGVGEVMALTWALEIGEPERFHSIADAVSYCGLCSALEESAGKTKRGPLSKQRNAHLQSMLVEAAKLAPRWNAQLAAVHARELEQGANPNWATLAVARKLVAYLLAVDKSREVFKPQEEAA
jgi:transposase